MALLVPSCSLLIDSNGFSGGTPAGGGDGSVGEADVTTGTDGATDGSNDGTSSEGSIDASGLDPYPRAVLEDKPLLYYRFEETSGINVKDEVGAFAAIINGNITRGAEGAFAKSLGISLNGMTGWISAGGNGDFDFTGNQTFSLECWVKPDVMDSSFRHPFTKDYEDGSNIRQEYGVYVFQGRIVIERWVDDVGESAGSGTLPVGQWYHVVGTYDAAQLALYINGALADTSPDTRSAKPKPTPLYVGAHEPDYGVIKGSLDEVAVYGTALTSQRVKAHYDASKQQ